MNNKKLTVGLDVDDVLYNCVEYAIKIANNRYNLNLAVDKIHTWELQKEYSVLLDIFKEPWFYDTQPIYPYAHTLVNTLLKNGHEVFFVTAVEKEGISARKQKLKQDFPQIKKVFYVKDKNTVAVDMLVDDSPTNIKSSKARFPVIYRKNWNLSLKSKYEATNYLDVIELATKFSSIL